MRNINAISFFEQTHFDPSNVRVNLSGLNIRVLLGLSLSNQQIAGIAGAPTGSAISTSLFAQTTMLGSEQVPAGVYFEIKNAQYIRTENVVGIFRESTSAYGVYIKSVDFIAGGPKGLAARMIAVIVRQALAIGNIVRLRLLAAGGRSWDDLDQPTGERWGGYVAWPTYGFDMNLLPDTLNIIPE